LRKIEYRRIGKTIEKRNEKFERFAQDIPHSDVIYTKETIKDANQIYGGFIVGSDQIWNPRSLDTSFFLDFAEKGKKRIAYAVSICRNTLSESERLAFSQGLQCLDAVSLRERDEDLIQRLTDKTVHWVLDPTMLLPLKYWDTVASDRIIKEEYVLCYFLGDSRDQRKIAKKYVKNKHLLLVTMPHLAVRTEVHDIGFGDVQMVNVSPQEFLSLVKYANCILTDSFHATVFSLIFEKNFFVFNRNRNDSMNSRIYSLTELFGTENRFCYNKKRQSAEYIQSVPDHDYSTNNEKLGDMINKSVDYLLNNVKNS